MRMVKCLAGAVTASCLVAGLLPAQSAQRLSVQVSGLYASLYGGDYDEFEISDGMGIEGQLRYTPGALSLGAGFQYTIHTSPGGTIHFDDPSLPSVDVSEWDGALYGFFVEPRYVIALRSALYAPYLSGRLSLLRYEDDADWRTQDGSITGTMSTSTTGLTVNGGGGVLVRFGPRVNMDLGVTYGYSNFDEYEVIVRSGGDSEQAPPAPAGTGSNIVVRLGLAIGLGL